MRTCVIASLLAVVVVAESVDRYHAPGVADLDARLHDTEHYDFLFRHWTEAHNVQFRNEFEYQRRLDVFARNNDLIEEHNAAAREGKHTYTLGHNAYSHLTWEEFKAQRMGLRPRDSTVAAAAPAAAAAQLQPASKAELPEAVDWTEKSAVTEVKNQGMCGSCWAFSAVGALEGAYAIATGQLMNFSEEQLLDCDKKDGGCGGGEMESAFEWMTANGGMCLAADYPYTGLLPPWKTCKTVCKNVPGTAVRSWVKAEADELSVMAAVAQRPLAIGIEADKFEFQLYSDGVFSAADCGTNLDHGVLLVGYGTSEEGVDYWKVKNSWGASWGKQGYILLARSSDADAEGGECGVLMDATYPVLASEPEPPQPAPAAAATAAAAAASGSLLDLFRSAAHDVMGAADQLLGETVETVMQRIREQQQQTGAVTAAAVAKDCGAGTTAAFTSVVIAPEQPKAGEPVQLRASGLLLKPVTTGTYKLSVKLAGLTVYKHSGPVCGESTAEMPLHLGKVKLHGLACPSSAGPVSYGIDVELPGLTPTGQYTIELTGKDQDGADLLCLSADLSL